MKNKDLKIISYLRQNARMPLTKMSKKTQIPVSTIFDRLRTNEDDLIQKHTCLLDFKQLGFDIWANVSLQVDVADRNNLREYLLRSKNVNSVYKVSGNYDFLLECVFKNMRDLDGFIDDIEEKYLIKEKDTFFLVEDIKRESFMSDPNTVSLLMN